MCKDTSHIDGHASKLLIYVVTIDNFAKTFKDKGNANMSVAYGKQQNVTQESHRVCDRE